MIVLRFANFEAILTEFPQLKWLHSASDAKIDKYIYLGI